MNNFTPNTRRAIKAYGFDKCLRAWEMHDKDGEGAFTVGCYLGIKTRQADAAINAGLEISRAASAKVRYYTEEDGHKETLVDGLLVIKHLKATDRGCWSDPRTDRVFDAIYQHLGTVTKNKVLSVSWLNSRA